MEFTEIKKHILLYMMDLKKQGKTEEEVKTKTKYMLQRLLHAVDNGAATEAMRKAEENLRGIDEAMRRAQANER